MKLRIQLAVCVLALVASVSELVAAPARFIRNIDRIPDSYVVILDDAQLKRINSSFELPVRVISKELTERVGGRIKSVWFHGIRGFAAEMTEQQALALSMDSRVALVEEDSKVFISASPQATDSSLWNLDRIDDLAGTDGTYEYGCGGLAVRVYVVDTGTRQTHQEFLSDTGGVRVTSGFDAVGDGVPATNPCGGAAHGFGDHGTAVSSVVAGRTFGVAKGATIVPVKVFSCFGGGSTTTVMNGLDWVAADYDSQFKNAVVNMSIGFRMSGPPPGTFGWTASPGLQDLNAMEILVGYLIDAGITVVTAAGNQNVDASYISPARLSRVITVGGTSRNDRVWLSANPVYSDCGLPTCTPARNLEPGSNWGPLVDIWAPAEEIRAASIGSDTAERVVLSGTSYSAAMVSGLAARYFQPRSKVVSGPTSFLAWLQANAINGALNADGLHGGPNKLVYAPFSCQ